MPSSESSTSTLTKPARDVFKLQLRVTPETAQGLRLAAAISRLTMSDLVTQWVDSFLDSPEAISTLSRSMKARKQNESQPA